MPPGGRGTDAVGSFGLHYCPLKELEVRWERAETENQLAPPRQKTPGPWGTISHLVSHRQLRTRAKIATRTAALTLHKLS